MFALPNSKRVRRDELLSPRSSRSPSPAESTTAAETYTSLLRNAYSSLETYTPPEPEKRNKQEEKSLEHTNEDDDAEQEFEFRLFYKPSSSAHAAAGQDGHIPTTSSNSPQKSDEKEEKNAGIQKLKLRLRSPNPLGASAASEGGFLVPFRGWEYYFTEPELVIQALDGKAAATNSGSREKYSKRRARNYIDAAVSGEDVVRNAREQAWPGTHLPWRIIHLKTSSSSKLLSTTQLPSSSQTFSNEEKTKKKKKPGKKRRIILRKRSSTTKAIDDAEREKRAKRNREKKLKKRMREKEKKVGMRNGGDHGDGEE